MPEVQSALRKTSMGSTATPRFDIFLLSLFFVIQIIYVSSSGCKYPKGDEVEQKRIQSLVGKRYQGPDSIMKYQYEIGICTEGTEGEHLEAGVVQYETKSDSGKTKFVAVIGKYTEADILPGTDWVILEYGGGKPYNSHCGSEPRKARIMITCDPSISLGNEEIVVLEEERNKTENCYYLFEMKSSVVCPPSKLITVSLSVGSILVIVFVCVASLYLILGFLYSRFVLGAKGKEQCPNHSFWEDFGNLEADGCDLVCRSGRPRESPTYKGIGDDQLQDEDERDDNLLPM